MDDIQFLKLSTFFKMYHYLLIQVLVYEFTKEKSYSLISCVLRNEYGRAVVIDLSVPILLFILYTEQQKSRQVCCLVV